MSGATGPQLVAVIDIGSSAIRMVVAEILGEDQWKVLDSAERPVALGRDVFVTGQISKGTLSESVQILKGFQELLIGWGVKPQDIRAVATSALREAQNRDTFIDRVFIKCGIQISVVEGIEANNLTFIAVQKSLSGKWGAFNRSNTLILEVGGGSTEVLLLQRGKVLAAHTLNMGTVRLEQEIKSSNRSGRGLNAVLKESVHNLLTMLSNDLPLKRVANFVALGGDIRIAALNCGVEVAPGYLEIEAGAYKKFVQKILPLSLDEIVLEFQISYHDAESLLPTLLAYQHICQATAAKK